MLDPCEDFVSVIVRRAEKWYTSKIILIRCRRIEYVLPSSQKKGKNR